MVSWDRLEQRWDAFCRRLRGYSNSRPRQGEDPEAVFSTLRRYSVSGLLDWGMHRLTKSIYQDRDACVDLVTDGPIGTAEIPT